MTATETGAAPGTVVDLRRPQAQPSAIPAKIAYARALAESGLLPAAYRKQPANILWAVEYGDMLGLSTMAAITGVHVIDGKPAASAGLISALVRRAGHKLHVGGNNKSATCVIIRSDDPGRPFQVTWTLKRNSDDNPSAEEAKLLGKAVWQQYPASMLKARAITQCARDACEEALFGLHYTPEELGADVDEDGLPQPVPSAEGDAYAAGYRAAEGAWESFTADPPCQDADQDPPPGDGWPGIDQALKDAASFTTEAAGIRLWKAAGQAVLDGTCTPGQRDHVQNLVNARIHDRRRQAAARILRPVDPDDAWRVKILDELASDDDARDALGELGRLKGDGAMPEDRATLLGRAVIARFPKAAVKAGDGDA